MEGDGNLALEGFRQYFPDDFPEEDMMALLEDPELFEQYLAQVQQQYAAYEQDYEVYRDCIHPVLTQSWESIYLMLLFCLVIRATGLLRAPALLMHVSSICLGCCLLWRFFAEDLIYVLLPCVLMYAVSFLNKNPLNISLVAALYLVVCEFYYLEPILWNKIKGSVMITCMNIIALLFDRSDGVITDIPTTLHFWGYVLNPVTVIFGPFLTYKDYMVMIGGPKLSVWWLINSLKCLTISGACLLWSSCGSAYYLPMLERYVTILSTNRWWDAYKLALSFRFSHYFVCYLSQGACLLAGIPTIYKKEEGKEEIKWERPIAILSQVELPRSLVDVVTNWNLPHHYWLKQYIFKGTRKFGVLAAILLTYIASAFLHSLNFQLSAVLLSIGVFAYIESTLRQFIADFLSVCVEARPCRPGCQHQNKNDTFLALSLNVLFTCVAMWNLAYLGCVFDSSSGEEQGYSMTHTLEKWGSYSYVNHWSMLIMLLTQRLLQTGRII